MSIATAITCLQAKALALTGVSIKAAPDLPIEDASVLPLSIVHVVSGSVDTPSYGISKQFVTFSVDYHFDRTSIKETYRRIDALIPEFLAKLSGDPNLGGAVDTIVFPVTYTVQPADWSSVVTHMVSFQITCKMMEDAI